MKRSLKLFAVIAVCTLVVTGSVTTSFSQDKKLKIGVHVILTGPGSQIGPLNQKGAQLAADWINSKGGINIKGEKYLMDLAVVDEKGAADQTIASFRSLVEVEKVKFITGGASPTNSSIGATVTEPAKVLRSLWWGEGTPKEINASLPYTFRANHYSRDAIPGLYKYLVEAYPKTKRVALATIDSPGAPFTIDTSTKEGAAPVGLEVVFTELYPRTIQDFYPYVTKMVASKPDAIHVTGGYPHLVGGIMKAAREMGFNGPVFATSPSPYTEIMNIVGKNLATDYFSFPPYTDSPDMTPMIKEIREMSMKKYGRFNTDVLLAWDGVWCLAQAIEKAQSLDPTAVKDVWEKMTTIETAYGKGQMGGIKTYGINHVVVKAYGLGRIKNGTIEHVKWVMPSVP
ncbi:MAG: ABC transporter substrate-binding protein [Thermodesulfobacteriota bacterium]